MFRLRNHFFSDLNALRSVIALCSYIQKDYPFGNFIINNVYLSLPTFCLNNDQNKTFDKRFKFILHIFI